MKHKIKMVSLHSIREDCRLEFLETKLDQFAEEGWEVVSVYGDMLMPFVVLRAESIPELCQGEDRGAGSRVRRAID